jgi:hypothetical protein
MKFQRGGGVAPLLLPMNDIGWRADIPSISLKNTVSSRIATEWSIMTKKLFNACEQTS